MESKRKITLIGLGKLGLPFLAAFASRGFRVIGVDIDIDKLCKLSWGTFQLIEPGVKELLERYFENYWITNKVVDAVSQTDTTFVLVPTPSETSGAFSTQFVLNVCKDIAEALAQKSKYHLISILSTVMPGSMARIKEFLEKESGKQCGRDFGLCYSPELVAIGNILEGFLKPDFVMVGESDARAGRMLTEIYRDVFLNNPPVERSNFVNVELAKITLNAYITTKISFANSLAEICEKISGADATKVTDIIGQDRRIGKKYLKPALGYSGFCFPRDSRAFIHMAKELDIGAPISEATDAVNSRQINRVVTIVREQLPQNGVVSVLGIAFKPDTDTTEESQGLGIAQELANSGIQVLIHDPLRPENLENLLLDGMEWVPELDRAIRTVDIVAIANPCREYKDLKPGDFKKGATVIDCWKILDESEFRKGKKFAETEEDQVKLLRLGTYFGE